MTEVEPIDRTDQHGQGVDKNGEWDDPFGDNWDGNDSWTLDGCDILRAPAHVGRSSLAKP